MWQAREIRFESHKQWYVDDGISDPLPCGDGTEAQDRAEKLAELLNFGVYAKMKATAGAKKAFIDGLRSLFSELSHLTLALMGQAAANEGMKKVYEQVERLNKRAVELQKELYKAS